MSGIGSSGSGVVLAQSLNTPSIVFPEGSVCTYARASGPEMVVGTAVPLLVVTAPTPLTRKVMNWPAARLPGSSVTVWVASRPAGTTNGSGSARTVPPPTKSNETLFTRMSAASARNLSWSTGVGPERTLVSTVSSTARAPGERPTIAPTSRTSEARAATTTSSARSNPISLRSSASSNSSPTAMAGNEPIGCSAEALS